MSKFLVVAAALGAISAFALTPQLAQARSCSSLTATAHGVTQGVASTKAQWRLQRYVRRNLSGARVGHASSTCKGWGVEGVRPACERSAIVCS